MISKWIKRKEVPKNSGKSKSSELEKLEYVKVFELQLGNMEDSPVYELKHQLSIGSEIGNIVIADPSVSPRHASFILQEEVVSVLDHGSVAGTFINGKKIAPGKYIILEDNDTVMVGDLEVRILTKTETAPLESIPEIPEDPEPPEIPEIPEFKVEQEEIKETIEEKKSPPKKSFDVKEHLKKSPKEKKVSKIVEAPYAANALVRVFAVLCDLLLSYSVLIVFMPFDDFRNFIEFVPTILGESLGINWGSLWSVLMEDYAFIGEMLNEAYQFFSDTFQLGPILIMFVVIRVATTFLLGVSISEFAVGIRSFGNSIWARIGGVLRVLLGIITGPFLIFDVPAIISRRTFKEFMTFTCTTLGSKFISVLGIIFYLPLLLVLALASPMLQGLEPPEPIFVSDRIDQRVRVKIAEGDSPAEVIYKKEQSKSLRLGMDYDPQELTLIPQFKFHGVKAKLNLKSGLIFYQRDLQRPVSFEVLKKFDLKQLLGIGIKGNFFLYDKYPTLYNFVYSIDGVNPHFIPNRNEKDHLEFANEFIRFTKMAFSLSLDNFTDIMQEETLLLKGLVDYKAAFLSLLEYKGFTQLSFIKIGNILCLRISYDLQKPFDLIVPLIKHDTQIFKVTWDKKESLEATSSKFYKFNLEKSDWLTDTKVPEGEIMSALEVFDLFSSNDFKSKLMTGERAQRLYGYYFETSQEILKRGDIKEIDIWKVSVRDLPRLIDSIPDNSEMEEGKGLIKLKLFQNFQDLNDALENKNYEYFGISQTTTI